MNSHPTVMLWMLLGLVCIFLVKRSRGSDHETYMNVPPTFDMAEVENRIAKGREELARLQQKSLMPKGACVKVFNLTNSINVVRVSN
jgi:hypothetical protein